MAHGILENDTMFSVKEKPWHKLGTVVESAPSVKEAIKLAGLDWKVEQKPIYINDGSMITTHKAIVKENTSDVLGVVGSSYQPLQNVEAFNWFEPFVENELATLETAGSLFNGKKVWVLAKTKKEANTIQEKIIAVEDAHPRQPRCIYFGEEVQIDASIHPWFANIKSALHAAIDDSTGQVLAAHFDEQETLNGYYNIYYQILIK